MAENPYAPAQRKAALAKIAITGVAGCGKTYTAFQIAQGLLPPGKRFCCADTENGKSNFYADDFPFDMLVINPPFTSAKFLGAIHKAHQFGYEALVIDGISPWWEGVGGVLQIVDENQQKAGGWSVGRPHDVAMQNALLAAPIHVICTVRAKADTVIQAGQNGGMRPVQVGMKPTMSKDMHFVFDFMFYVDHATHALETTKTRWHEIDGQDLAPDLTKETAPAREMAERMRAWLAEGVKDTETPSAVQTPPTQPEPAREGDVPFTPPAGGATGDGGLLDAATKPEVDITSATPAQVDTILARVATCKELDDSKDWVDLVTAKFPEWFGREATFDALTTTEAATVAERLDSLIITLKARKEQA